MIFCPFLPVNATMTPSSSSQPIHPPRRSKEEENDESNHNTANGFASSSSEPVSPRGVSFSRVLGAGIRKGIGAIMMKQSSEEI